MTEADRKLKYETRPAARSDENVFLGRKCQVSIEISRPYNQSKSLIIVYSFPPLQNRFWKMWRSHKCLQRPVRSTQGGRLSERNAFPCCVNGMCQGGKTPVLSWLSRGSCCGPFPLYLDHLHDLNTTMCSIVNKTRRFAIATVSECGPASVLPARQRKVP